MTCVLVEPMELHIEFYAKNETKETRKWSGRMNVISQNIAKENNDEKCCLHAWYLDNRKITITCICDWNKAAHSIVMCLCDRLIS